MSASLLSSADGTAPADHAPQDRAFFGHPRGLGFIAVSEGWISFSYYGMQSLLVLYMLGRLLTPGHVEHVWGFPAFRAGLERLYGPLSGQPLASAITGLYGALVYATPIAGGLLADRWLGRTRTVVLGAVLMTVGHFLMAFEASFLPALLCLVLGMGCAGVLKAQAGELYAPGDLRRADAFQIYVLAVSAAVIVAPLVCGWLGQKVAWSLGFGAAGAGMLVGLVVYLCGRRWLPPEPARARGADRAGLPRLSAREWRTVGVLVLLLPVLAAASTANMEIFNGYLIWGQENYRLEVFGQVLPASWLLSMDAFVSAATLGLVVAFWRWWGRRRREPDEIVKIALGAGISALGPLALAAAAAGEAASGHKVGLAWGLLFHTVNDVGFANMYAVGIALYSRASPPALGATLVSGYSLHLFLANLIVGRLAGLLSRMPATEFWLLHAAVVAGAAAALAVCARLFHRTLAPSTEAER